MNNNGKGKGLIAQLEQEISWIDELNQILSEEKLILATRQFEQLEDLANTKQKLSNHLEESAQARAQLLGIDKPNTDAKAALQTFLQSCSTEDAQTINNLNSKLAEKLNFCRDLNTVNGQVIASNLHTRQEIVNALTGNRAEAASVYTASGDMDAPSSPKHYEEA